MARRGPLPWLSRLCIALIILTLIVPSLPPARAAGTLTPRPTATPTRTKAVVGGSTRIRPTATKAPTSPPNGPVVGFAGTSDTNYGALTLDIQDGNVTGAYEWQDGRLVGAVSPDGRTLTGTWSQAPTHLPPRHAGRLVLHLSEDGQSLTGEWGYGSRLTDGAWAGARLAPPPVSSDSAPTSTPALTRHSAPIAEPTTSLVRATLAPAR